MERTLQEEKSLVRPLHGCYVSREAAQSSLISEAEEGSKTLYFEQTEDTLPLLHLLSLEI